MATKRTKTFLDLIKDVENVPLDFDYSGLYKLHFMDDPRPHGFMTPEIVSKMPWGTAPVVINHEQLTVHLSPPAGTPDPAQACTAALQSVVDAVVAADAFGITHGNHGELCRVLGLHPAVDLERYPAPLFGLVLTGACMICYVRDYAAPYGMKLWVARRAGHLVTYPGMLDVSVGGCTKAGDGPLDTVLAEAREEAGLDPAFVREHARAASVITGVSRSKRIGAVSCSLGYVFDLELASDVVPVPTDGEVECFYLWDVDKVKAAMLGGEVKPNCNLAFIDFFVRHGIISAENEADYVEIATRLRRPLPLPTKPDN